MLVLRGRRAGPRRRGEAEKRLGAALLFDWGWLGDGGRTGHRGRGHARVIGNQWFIHTNTRVIDWNCLYFAMGSAGTGGE